MMNSTKKPEFFILDLDGVLTDGKFYYGANGKELKAFSVDDHDALKYLRKVINVQVVTADAKGLDISKRRIEYDMELPLHLIPAENRVERLASKFDLKKTIYMGDGILDFLVFKEVMYSICPSSSLSKTKKCADFVTESKGGERAVAEACIEIFKKFFPEFNIFK